MESFTWWNDEHKALTEDVREFVDRITPRAEEAFWERRFPMDILESIAKEGYFGAGVPKEYGGMGLGATGACIAIEEISRLPGAGWIFGAAMLGGWHQVIDFGTEEQKKRFLPRMAKGELGAVAMTEPGVGTDVASIETSAKRQGDKYIINGKKRFATGTGVGNRYMLYARTSDDPEDIRKHRQLTGFIVEKGMPGFTIEKINEVMGFDNVPNGYLSLIDVPVPVANRIGEEGQGWRVMVMALNYERALVSAQVLGAMREALRAIVSYGQRRIQFGKPTIDIPTNQFKVADMLSKLKLARLATYYAAQRLDEGKDAAVDCSVAKVFGTDAAVELGVEAIQVMGGDGTTKFYPLQRILNESKVAQIAGGTNEAIKITIYRMGLKAMAEDFKMPRRVRHQKLGVPITSSEKPKKLTKINEESLLAVLAEDYRVNPGLYMSLEDLKEAFAVSDAELGKTLLSLEAKELVKLQRKGETIALAKATYEGLKKANPPDYYRWFPPWVKDEDIF
ncbi:MAG: acyl-CoA dehydrogenase family protein [Dehalococcoidia bacterium]|jgi:alkylation response protein AidB-like acyl-CoA dehydrogenase